MLSEVLKHLGEGGAASVPAGGQAGGVGGMRTLLPCSVPPHPCLMVPFRGVWGCLRLEVSCRFLREETVASPGLCSPSASTG